MPDGKKLLRSIDSTNPDYELIRQLIRNGADVNICDENGDSLLQLCVMDDKYEIFALLMRAGANPHAVNQQDNSTALHDIFMPEGNVNNEKTLMFRDLLCKNVSADAKFGKSGFTALHLALLNDSSYSSYYVEQLLQYGADFNIYDNSSLPRDALYLAVFYHRYQHMSRLLQAGADINRTDQSGHTMLHRFVTIGDCHQEISILLRYGIDYNKIDNSGSTAYDLALYYVDDGTADFLTNSIQNMRDIYPMQKG
jgi:ankyrin repeat protein